jgi:hypothetical protein
VKGQVTSLVDDEAANITASHAAIRYDGRATSTDTEQLPRSIIPSQPAQEVRMKVYKPEWRCTFSVNEGAEASASLKERIAWRLREFADRLEGGGRTIKIDCDVTPRVSREEVDSCLGKGFAVTQGLLTQLAHQAACEKVMRDAKAELFEEEDTVAQRD